ncbi:MAG: MBL fold metallo-hydrolase [Halobacteriaceae archaeon]
MSVSYDSLTFDRLGHASVRIQTGDDTVIYIDPWSDVISQAPRDGDIVFVTHDDFDHWDPDGIKAVAKSDATIAAYEAIDTAGEEFEVIELPYDGSVRVEGIEVTTVPAYNRATGEHVDDAGNPFHAQGEVIGLILHIDSTSVFFPSDTDFLDHHTSIKADVFMPPIGGHYTMDRHEAADFARSVDPDLVLPVHYNTFEAIETDEEAFVEELERDDIRVSLF